MGSHNHEVVIIGSGACGGIAALTFAQAGVKVLVVEAGPDLSLDKVIGTKACNNYKRFSGIISGRNTIQSQHPGYWKANPSLYIDEKLNPYSCPPEKPFLWTQGKQVGGRSLTWGGITLRMSDHEFKASRIDSFGPEWPISYEDLRHHYSYIEKFLKVHGNKDGLSQLPDGDYENKLPLTSSEKYFADAIKSSECVPLIHSRGFGPHTTGNKEGWPKSSSIGSTLKEAIATGNVEIISDKMAFQIKMNSVQDKAKSVLVIDQKNGGITEINAKLIVLAASTIQTIRILLNSEKKNNEKGFIDPSGYLGSFIMDHISTCQFFTLDKYKVDAKFSKSKTNQLLSGAGSFFLPFGGKMDLYKNKDFIRGYGIWGGIDRFEPPSILKSNPDTYTGFLIAHGEVLADKSNKISLSDRIDSWGIKTPHIEVSWKENEKKMSSNMNLKIKEIINAADGHIQPLQEIINAPFTKQILKNAYALQDESPPPGYYIHEVGGAPMGFKEETSVTNKFNVLWRCSNVLIVDGACWPTSGWQSPTLTMMAITRRACLEVLKPQNG